MSPSRADTIAFKNHVRNIQVINTSLSMHLADRQHSRGPFAPATSSCQWDLRAAIHPLLGLPKDYACPPFETNDSWHSVVLHGFPAATINADPTALSPKEVQSWLALKGEIRGKVKATSVLCSPADLKTKRRVAVRVSLSSSEDALSLVKNGACLFGAMCRVTPLR
ncbi:hypothetical protein B0H14DRAFT_3455896 [Mycena olivaceomarginata]|nr:hypothetical protein B0H14DRAFT_3455896 [Mycena olivaceomarginata]